MPTWNGKKGEKKKATLSAKEITVLATLKEVVDVVKKRAKKKGEWEKKTNQEWREKIQRRVEGSKKKQKERREERVEKEKKSSPGRG